ncbi:MAG TPA: ester cyclase [Streptosporangiaceae bacterium]|nr:ester cyclase [Streptosporangiaceae bacterium]
MQPTQIAHDLVMRFYDSLWNQWDDDAVEDTLAPDFRFRGSLGDQTVGRDGWRTYRDKIRLASPDFHNEVVDLVVAGDRAAARLLYRGTHSGPLLGIAPTGRSFSYAGAAFFAVAGNSLSEAWVLGDLAALRAQLEGAGPD